MELKIVTNMLTYSFLLLLLMNNSAVNGLNLKDVLTAVGSKLMEKSNVLLMKAVKNNLCLNHTYAYIQQLVKGDYWAMKMFDSSAKIPDGVFTGLLTHLGNFDECIEVEDVPPDVGHFKGQYCLASFKVSIDNLPKTLKASADLTKEIIGNTGMFDLKENVSHVEKKTQGLFTLKELALNLAYCIPSTCTAKNFEDGLNHLLGIAVPHSKVVASVRDDFCQIKNAVSLQTEDWVTVAFLIFICIIIVLSTAYDLLIQENKRELLKAFSLYTNGKRLLNTQSAEDILGCVHGIRFLSMCWIILAHWLITNFSLPAMNLTTFTPEIKKWYNYYIINATLSVDTFLVMSGLLVSYVFLKHTKKKRSGFNIPKHYFHRYVRLTPPYAVMILLQGTLLRYMFSGPLLKQTANRITNNCHTTWWTNLLYINNYVEYENQCLQHSWYLALDMQLFLLSPLILYPLWKWSRRWNITILSVLIIAGIISPLTVSYVHEIPGKVLLSHSDEGSNYAKHFYYPTYVRFGPWVIGVAFGYVLSETRNRKVQLSKLHVFLIWSVGLVALVGSLEGAYPFYQPHEQETLIAEAFYNGFFRNTWALGVGIVIFMCTTGYGGPVNTLLSWKALQPLSRLTYCVYLTHRNVQIFRSLSIRTPNYLSYMNMYAGFFADLIVSFNMAAVLSLCFESPIIVIEKYLLYKGRRVGKELKQYDNKLHKKKTNATSICSSE